MTLMCGPLAFSETPDGKVVITNAAYEVLLEVNPAQVMGANTKIEHKREIARSLVLAWNLVFDLKKWWETSSYKYVKDEGKR